MKKTLLLLLLAPIALIANPTEEAKYWFDLYTNTGGNMTTWVNETDGFINYAETLWSDLQSNPRELYAHEPMNLARYAWFAEGLQDEERADISRAVGAWEFPRFIRVFMTEEEIREHIFPLAHINHITNVQIASNRLGSTLLTDFVDLLIGTGIHGETPQVARYYGLFAERIRLLTQAGNYNKAVDLLNSEIAGLVVLPEKTEAVKNRISDLEGQAVIFKRMADRASN